MKKLIALLMAILMATTMMTVAMADGETTEPEQPTTTTSAYTPVTPASNKPEMTHTLTLTNGVTSLGQYSITYDFTVTEPTIMQPADITTPSLAFTGNPVITDITYDGKTEFEGTPLTKTTNLEIDWRGVSIKQPGVYRWTVKIDKSSTDPNETASTSYAYLYVYAVDNAGVLQIDSVGWTTNGDLDSTEEEEANHKADDIPDQYPSTFVNLTIDKTVTGNQGSKDQYFKFEIHLTTPANYGTTTHAIEGENYDAEVPATAYHEEKKNLTSISLTGGKKTELTMWLKHDQSAVIKNLPYGTVYTIVEAATGYTVDIAVTGDSNAVITKDTATVTDESLTADAIVAYTNNKVAEVPTGIDLQTAAPVVCLLMAMGLMFMVFAGKRKEETV